MAVAFIFGLISTFSLSVGFVLHELRDVHSTVSLGLV